MWNVACKDPLEAERVGERRERKLRQSDQSRSSWSSDTASVKRLDLAREGRRTSRSSHTTPTITTPETSSLYEMPEDPSTKGLRGGAQNGRPAKPVGVKPTSPRPDSNGSGVRHRSKYGDEQIDLAMERLQVGHATFRDESPTRLGYVDGMDGVEDVKDFSRKGRKTPALSARSMMQSPTPVNFSPKSASGPDFASHQTERATQRRVHHSPASSMVRFQRLLRKIEIANAKRSCERLLEQWEGDDKDLEAEFRFETTLWALVGLEKMCTAAQSNYLASMPNYCLDGASMVQIQDGMDVLQLGPVHDSPEAWYMGAKHSLATICDLAIHPSSLDLPSSSWGWPSNVDSSLWNNCPIIPHPDNTFDVVLIHPIFHVLPCTDWPVLIKEAVRVLVPGNCLAIQVIDPVPKRAGPLLEAWTTHYLSLGLARRFMASRPKLLLPCWIEDFAAFSETLVEAIELPIHTSFTPRDVTSEIREASSPRSTSRKASQRNPLDTIDENSNSQGRKEAQFYASLVGKHLYRSMYEEFAPVAASPTLDGGPHSPSSRCWWWDDPAILDECRRFDAVFELVTYICRKDGAWPEEDGSR